MIVNKGKPWQLYFIYYAFKKLGQAKRITTEHQKILVKTLVLKVSISFKLKHLANELC